MDTSLLRALAVLLIANSHLESFYPIRQLAGDGLIGNSLFFMLSGFGLSMSPSIRQGRFRPWYGKRLSRVYIPLWLTVIVATLFAAADWEISTPTGFLAAFFWPTPYAFLSQIILFYPLYYFIKTANYRALSWFLPVGLIAVYLPLSLFAYNIHVLSWLFDFAIMLFGGWLATNVKQQADSTPASLTALLLSLFVYLALKIAMTTGRMPAHVGLLHLLMFPLIYSLMRLTAHPGVQKLSTSSQFAAAIAVLASLTLEIYLVHEFVYHDTRVQSLPFPGNIAVFWAVTLPLAWLLARSADAARKLVTLRPFAPGAAALTRLKSRQSDRPIPAAHQQ